MWIQRLSVVLLATAGLSGLVAQEEGEKPEVQVVSVEAPAPDAAEESAEAVAAPDVAAPDVAAPDNATVTELDLPVGEAADAATAAVVTDYDLQQQASYILGFLRAGPAVTEYKLDTGMVVRGMTDGLDTAKQSMIAIPPQQMQAEFEQWEKEAPAWVEQPEPEVASENPEEWSLRLRASYMFGLIPMASVVQQADLEAISFGAGLLDKATGLDPKIALADEQRIIGEWTQELQARAAKRAEEAAAQGKEYLVSKALEEGVTKTASGLLYEVLKEGDGPKPVAQDTVRVHYHGTLIDGSVFDSSEDRGMPTSFRLDGVIRGWTEGLQLMGVGSRYRFHIPSELGYGPQGTPSGSIPGDATLVFEVELLGIE